MKKNCGTVSENFFSVLQTIEAGKPVLSVVPQRWVQGKYLFWPDRNAEKLNKDPSSRPASSWNKIVCSVKERRINNFFEAEEAAANLSGATTDVSDAGPPIPKKPRLKRTHQFNHQTNPIKSDMDFNQCLAKSFDGSNVTGSLPVSVILETPVETESASAHINLLEEAREVSFPIVCIDENLPANYDLMSFNLAQNADNCIDLAKREILDKLDKIKEEVRESIVDAVRSMLQ
ncbi:uncharacterized protein LOC129725714 isoform X2 [Wyeomyia smithii]|uniref:uncharacterized protein LOC129725714 isoform X2 n=1 Tax=Wyeomyia smithii TaxID=174621 RepID=UPI002467E43D|nr:uncharacterized protein LOC129725714 isoform X2 [Wyeomyia smithii]